MKSHRINEKIQIPYIGQGFGGIRDGSKNSNLDENVYIEALQFGVDVGLTFIDTAEAYADGYSEELIGKALSSIRSKVQIGTKFSPENHRYKDVIKSAEKSLKRLDTEYIDIYQIHWPNQNIPISETLEALAHLIEQGKILSVGVCNFSVRDLSETMSVLDSFKIVTNQVEYNLFDRFSEYALFEFCSQNEVKIIAYSPLDKGRTTDGDTRRKFLNQLSIKYGKSIEQIALNWLTSSDLVTAIPTTRNKSHILQNSQSLDFVMDDKDYELIDLTCNAVPELINVHDIEVSLNGEGARKVYQNMNEAIENKLNLCPSPVELSKFILEGDPIKPVRLRLRAGADGGKIYDLIEGRLRYWAWVIAFDSGKPIPAYVRQD